MGHGASFEQDAIDAVYRKKSIKDVVALMMPVYYTEVPVSHEDVVLAKANWEMILNDTSPVFIDIQNEGSDMASCMQFFYETFYGRLFDIHPVS